MYLEVYLLKDSSNKMLPQDTSMFYTMVIVDFKEIKQKKSKNKKYCTCNNVYLLGCSFYLTRINHGNVNSLTWERQHFLEFLCPISGCSSFV